jgi:hypothetical protein
MFIKLFGIFFLAFSFASAQEYQKITDLGFKPDKGQVVYTALIDSNSTDWDSEYTLTGSPVKSAHEVSASTTVHELVYGLSKNIYLDFTLSYTIQSEDTHKSYTWGSTAQTKDAVTNDNGIEDPLIGIIYRAYANEVDDNYFDLGAFISPSIGDAKRSSSYTSGGGQVASSDGNALRGGMTSAIGARYYGKLNRLEYALVGMVVSLQHI